MKTPLFASLLSTYGVTRPKQKPVRRKTMPITPSAHPSNAAARNSAPGLLAIAPRQNRGRTIAGLLAITLLLALSACKTIVVDSSGDVVDPQREASNLRSIAATTRALALNPNDADAYL